MNTPHSTSLIQIYGLIPYDRGAKVRWLLTELGIKFQNHWLDREKKEYESTEYLKINPMGKVPALVFDGQAMFESGAICAYLADRYLEKGLAPALDHPNRMSYLQWMYFASCTLDAIQVRIMIIEDIDPGPTQSEKQTALTADFRDALVALDRVVSKQSNLIGEHLTAADICVSYHLYWCSLWPELEAHLKDFPSVLTYLDRIKKRPAAILAEVFTYKP